MFGRPGRRKQQPGVNQLEGLEAVSYFLQHDMKFRITDPGSQVAEARLKAGYSPVEVASNLALLSVAKDVKANGNTSVDQVRFPAYAQQFIGRLKLRVQQGLMREELFNSDAAALIEVTSINAQSSNWIEMLLEEHPLNGEALAVPVMH